MVRSKSKRQVAPSARIDGTASDACHGRWSHRSHVAHLLGVIFDTDTCACARLCVGWFTVLQHLSSLARHLCVRDVCCHRETCHRDTVTSGTRAMADVKDVKPAVYSGAGAGAGAGAAAASAPSGTAHKRPRPADFEAAVSQEMQIIPLGAGAEVGRSCHILKYKGKTIMVRAGGGGGSSHVVFFPFFLGGQLLRVCRGSFSLTVVCTLDTRESMVCRTLIRTPWSWKMWTFSSSGARLCRL